MKLTVSMTAVLALGGCFSTPTWTGPGTPPAYVDSQTFIGPDGKLAHVIQCSGANYTMAECHYDARKLCGGNYTVNRESVTPRVNEQFGRIVSTENRSLEISCAPKAS